jgi:hypothetical protein
MVIFTEDAPHTLAIVAVPAGRVLTGAMPHPNAVAELVRIMDFIVVTQSIDAHGCTSQNAFHHGISHRCQLLPFQTLGSAQRKLPLSGIKSQ